jgi:hypothetical protein
VVRDIFHEGITPHLEYSIYSPGRPPWPTVDGTGAWLADHTAPASALFLPEGSPWPVRDANPIVLLGADSTVVGYALMWVHLDGSKLSGTKIRGWNGDIALARDIGSRRNPNHVVYTVFVDNPSRDVGMKDPGGLEIYIITKTGLELLTKLKAAFESMTRSVSWSVWLPIRDRFCCLTQPGTNSLPSMSAAPAITFRYDQS